MSNRSTVDDDVTQSPAPPTPNRPSTSPSPPVRPRPRLPRFDLSATQLIATGLAATTATFAASYLGVTGTVIGAALASVVTAAGNAVYGQSLRSTRDRVREAVPVLRHSSVDPARGTRAHGTPPVDPPALPAPRRAADPAGLWRRAAFGTVAVFVVLLAVVTGVELVAGRPISDVLRGDSGNGTSFFGDQQVRTTTVPATTTPTAPTTTVTVTPKVVVTTPTVIQTAPAVTQTATPTATVSPSASPTESDTSSPSASSSGTPTP